jgi:hypothetical protein
MTSIAMMAPQQLMAQVSREILTERLCKAVTALQQATSDNMVSGPVWEYGHIMGIWKYHGNMMGICIL